MANQTVTPIMTPASGPGGPLANPFYLVDQYGNPFTLASPIPVAAQHASVVDATNSSTTLLGSGGVFTGTWQSSLSYSALSIEVFSDKASAASGLQIQQSQDGTNADTVDSFTVSASTNFQTTVNLTGSKYRVVYTNTNSAQGTFRLQTVAQTQDVVLPRTLTALGNLKVALQESVATVALFTASQSGVSSGNSGDLDVSKYREVSIDITTTAQAGTNPTLQFFWERKGADNVYYPLWQSSSLTAASNTLSTSIGPGLAYNQSLGLTGRLRWVVGGTASPNWTFTPNVYGK